MATDVTAEGEVERLVQAAVDHRAGGDQRLVLLKDQIPAITGTAGAAAAEVAVGTVYAA